MVHALYGAGFPSKVNILEHISSLPPCYHSCVCCTYSVSQCVQLFCNHMDCRFPGSSVHEIFQERILEWVGMSSSRKSFCYPRVKGNKCWMDRFNSRNEKKNQAPQCWGWGWKGVRCSVNTVLGSGFLSWRGESHLAQEEVGYWISPPT